MGPTHTVVDLLDTATAALSPMTVTPLTPLVVVETIRLQVWEADPTSKVVIDDGVILLGWRVSDRPLFSGAAVRILSPLEALASCV